MCNKKYYKIKLTNCDNPYREFVKLGYSKNQKKVYFRAERYATLFENYSDAKRIIDFYLDENNCKIIEYDYFMRQI